MMLPGMGVSLRVRNVQCVFLMSLKVGAVGVCVWLGGRTSFKLCRGVVPGHAYGPAGQYPSDLPNGD